MNAIVAVDQNWAIGQEGHLLFSIPGDMRHFRETTTGGTVIMGRKTLESFPGKKPLPARRNIVVTHDSEFDAKGADLVPSPGAALLAAAGDDPDRIWLIGGATIYTALLSQCAKAVVTKVDSSAPEADAYFPNLDKLPTWEKIAEQGPYEENGLTYRFVTYRNKSVG